LRGGLREEARAAEGESGGGEGRGLERGAAGDFHGAAKISEVFRSALTSPRRPIPPLPYLGVDGCVGWE